MGLWSISQSPVLHVCIPWERRDIISQGGGGGDGGVQEQSRARAARASHFCCIINAIA